MDTVPLSDTGHGNLLALYNFGCLTGGALFVRIDDASSSGGTREQAACKQGDRIVSVADVLLGSLAYRHWGCFACGRRALMARIRDSISGYWRTNGGQTRASIVFVCFTVGVLWLGATWGVSLEGALRVVPCIV